MPALLGKDDQWIDPQGRLLEHILHLEAQLLVGGTLSPGVARPTLQRRARARCLQAEFADPKPRLTPNGALIAFRGHPSLTVDKIEKRTSELLTTYGIEVADVRPGRGRISVFVTREKRARVPLASTWLDALWPDR
ncbi:MAG: hypothetical protein CVT74_18060, partial [Alphaproteobacteria bacterium HGW-Alphaproteobacteria-13]